MIIHGLAVVLGLTAVFLILWDGFDYALIPSKPTRYARPSRLLAHRLWGQTRRVARWIRSERREAVLGWFGPLSLVATFAFWAVGLVLAFGLVQWGLESRLHDEFNRPGLFDYFYFSGVTFFTLGYGDIVPLGVGGRLVSLVEVGTGFSFLALMIGYFPVLTQAYAAREVEVVKLAVRADTPPTAGALLVRAGPADGFATLTRYFEQWESWAAAVYQSHIAYPVLGFYRSQWPGHSWLAAMTAMLDTASLMLTVIDGQDPRAARTLFTMVRHFIVELSDIYGLHRTPFHHGSDDDRISATQLDQLLKRLADNGFVLVAGDDALRRFHNLRETYEPYLAALGAHFCLELPPIQVREPISP
jgi:hypothetical protein